MSAGCPICERPAALDATLGDAGLSRCGHCEFLFLGPDAAPDTSALYDDEYFAGYDGGDYLAEEEQRRHESRLRLDDVVRRRPPPARLLEFGAAAGFFLDEARRLGYDGVGVEPNGRMAAHGRDRLGLELHTGLLEDLGLPAASVDVACAWHVVEHIPRPRQALAEVHRLLRPGGHLFVEVPNAASTVARRQGVSWSPLDLPYHVGHHSPRSLRTLLEGSGFEPVVLESRPFAFYEPRARQVAYRWAAAARESLRARAPLPPGPHPSAHQLLFAVARRPA
jgi:SAM-dependent methyltransferase